MSETNNPKPFKTLGNQLKGIREKRLESLSETSGAVEIDPELLCKYEEGLDRPGEDILLLLISHFATKEDVATKLWELAGYDDDLLPSQHAGNDIHGRAQNGVVVIQGDAQIAYTDMVHVMVNNYGVVMNFMQTAAPGSQPTAVSRVGMSIEHAKSVLEVLQKTLDLHSPKTLPHKNTNSKNNKSNQ